MIGPCFPSSSPNFFFFFFFFFFLFCFIYLFIIIFLDDYCNTHFYEPRPDLFYGLQSFSIVLASISFLGGVFLIFYYFVRFVPRAKKHSPLIIGIFLVTIAALLRMIEASMVVSFGPSSTRLFFYQVPNPTQLVLRFTLQLYYPFAFGATTLQILIWIEFVIAVKSLKVTVAVWFPRIKWVLIPIMVIFFILEIISQVLLYHNYDSSIIYYVYRAILILFMALLLVISSVFAVKYFLIISRTSVLDSKMSSRNKQSRRNLTIMVLSSLVFIVLGVLMAVLYVTLSIDTNLGSFWPYIFFLRFIELGLLLTLVVTSLAMMRNRVAYTSSKEESGTSSGGRGSSSQHSSSGSDRELLPMKKEGTITSKPSVARSGSAQARAGLAEPLIDYSAFGSAVEDDSEDAPRPQLRVTASTIPVSERSRTETGPLLDSVSSEICKFESGELAWAQYRMDGLWYAVRVENVSGNDVQVEYIDYDLSDTLPSSNVCPDYDGLLTGERLNPIKAFDSRPTKELLKEAGALNPDTFGLVRLRGKLSKKPNHSSLLLRRSSVK